MADNSQKHFDNISDSYQKASDSWNELNEQIELRLNKLVKNKDVLDVGNGGIFAYDTNLPLSVTAMDVAQNMMAGITDPKIKKIVNDARDMSEIKDASFDVIIFLLVLHHINGPNKTAALKTLDSIITASFQKLRPGGFLVINEALLSSPIYSIQSSLYRITHSILKYFGVSMIFFFTLPIIKEHISKITGLDKDDIEVIPLHLTGWIDPLGGSFPGLIKIPSWLQPWNFTLLLIKKG